MIYKRYNEVPLNSCFSFFNQLVIFIKCIFLHSTLFIALLLNLHIRKYLIIVLFLWFLWFLIVMVFCLLHIIYIIFLEGNLQGQSFQTHQPSMGHLLLLVQNSSYFFHWLLCLLWGSNHCYIIRTCLGCR